MSNILFLKTSPKNEGSISTELGEYLIYLYQKDFFVHHSSQFFY